MEEISLTEKEMVFLVLLYFHGHTHITVKTCHTNKCRTVKDLP